MTEALRLLRGLSLCFAFWMTLGSALAEPRQFDLQAEVDRVRTEYDLVGLGAVIATSKDGIVAVAVSGDRVSGKDDPVRITDSWHIGSNTKMLTALLYARLVEAGHARWGATLPDLFPALAADMDAGWKDVTIEDLLSHRSGAAANASLGWMLAAKQDKRPLDEQRAELARVVLSRPPTGTRGEFFYSNLGYIIAGAAIEQIAAGLPALEGEPYEALLRELVIGKGPKGAAEGFGFGPPPRGPEGHAPGLFGRGLKAQGRSVAADNPAALGPAGTVHYSLRGHALMLLSFLDGPRALPAPIRKKLMAPYPDAKSGYALGLGLKEDGPAGRIYMHAGSNTIWLSQVVLLPARGTVIIVNTNQYNPKAEQAVRELTGRLIEHVSAG